MVRRAGKVLSHFFRWLIATFLFLLHSFTHESRRFPMRRTPLPPCPVRHGPRCPQGGRSFVEPLARSSIFRGESTAPYVRFHADSRNGGLSARSGLGGIKCAWTGSVDAPARLAQGVDHRDLVPQAHGSRRRLRVDNSYILDLTSNSHLCLTESMRVVQCMESRGRGS